MDAQAFRQPDRQLGLLVSGLCLISLGAFAGQVYGVIDMTFVISFFALPAMIIVAGIAMWARGSPYQLFYKRLLLGLAIGAVATAAYDFIRVVQQSALPLGFNAFANHPRFGQMIVDQPVTSTAAIAVGWAYHFSNGLTFALCYTLLVGRASWYWGVAFALVLQCLMVAMYPTAFGVSRGNESFLLVSFTGHTVYGTVLGVLNSHFNETEAEFQRRTAVAV
jgi:hypothetical protein